MRKMKLLNKIIVIISALIILAISGHIIFYYNYLTDLRFNVLTEKGKISSAIQYRRNLAPLVIDSVSSLVEHEDNVFNRAVDARERSLTSGKLTPEELRKMKEKPFQEVMNKIVAIGEQYPSLVTSEAYQLMMQQVAEAEKNILVTRTNYNDAVNIYTTAMTMFPGNIYTALFEFPSYEYFSEINASEWSEGEIIEAERMRRKKRIGNESEI